jgi:glycosyltransferase involved in cell wall biosynthesis
MRVLHLLDSAVPRRNGYSQRTLALLGELRAQGVNTVQLTAPQVAQVGGAYAGAGQAEGHAPDPGSSGKAWHFYRTPAPWAPCARVRGLGQLAALGVLAWRLRQIARLTRPDLIHVHAPAGNALAAVPVARLARLPLVVELERRSATGTATPALERWALRRANALAAGSIEQRAQLQVAGLPGRRIAVIPPAPDLEPVGIPAQARGPAGLEGAPLIVYAGRLHREDGLDLLLSVLPQLRWRFPGLRLLLAGGGAREPELTERLGAPGLRGHVAVTGKLPRRRAAELLPRADIAVFPTLPGAHALLPARHLLNAMAQGCAVVASDIDCHRGLVVHGHSGILFGAGSGVALLDALLRLLAEPARLPALGRAAAGFVARERSWEATAARYRRLYEAVLAEHRRRR